MDDTVAERKRRGGLWCQSVKSAPFGLCLVLSRGAGCVWEQGIYLEFSKEKRREAAAKQLNLFFVTAILGEEGRILAGCTGHFNNITIKKSRRLSVLFFSVSVGVEYHFSSPTFSACHSFAPRSPETEVPKCQLSFLFSRSHPWTFRKVSTHPSFFSSLPKQCTFIVGGTRVSAKIFFNAKRSKRQKRWVLSTIDVFFSCQGHEEIRKEPLSSLNWFWRRLGQSRHFYFSLSPTRVAFPKSLFFCWRIASVLAASLL